MRNFTATKILLAGIASALFLSVAVESIASDCSDEFDAIKSWAPIKSDDYGKCHMENVPKNSEYPAEAIPYKLRNGKELCPRNRDEMDWEYLWENGKRVSGKYYLDSRSYMTLNYTDSFTPSGPVLIYRKNKLFCEVPINTKGKPDGVVKEYSPEGKLTQSYRMVNGKWEGGFVRFNKNGKLKSFACEEKPVFEGDSERCGFNGKPAIIELSDNTTLTHINGKLTIKETAGAGKRTVEKFSYSDTGEKTVQFTEYHKNGKPRLSYSKKNDKKDGKYLEYADNGKPVLEKEYKDGTDIEAKSYYMNGKLKKHTVRNSDGKSLLIKEYWDNGQLQSTGVYAVVNSSYSGRDDIPTGKHYTYTETGALSEEANFDEEGKREGAQIFVDEKGKRYEAVYRKGKLTAKKIFTADGKLELSEEYYEDGSRK